MTEINIRQVRHLQNIKIVLSQNEKKHLLFTGINGCGKSSAIKAIGNSFLHAILGNSLYICMLNRESNFAGFKRSIELQSEELMQCLGKLMN